MIALSMITNDAKATIKVLEQYGQYFDKWFITVADKDKKQLDLLKKLDRSNGSLQLSYLKWEDNFGKAREFNRKQIDTEYFFWMDSDDRLVNPEQIPQLVKLMEQRGLDAIYLRYDYIHNDQNEAIGDHWRERIVRTEHFKWAQTRVHETLIAPAAATMKVETVWVEHDKTPEQEQKSLERNIKLLKLEFEETKDPRIALYLGDNLIAKQEYKEAEEYLLYLLQNGGWDEDKYRAWLKLAEIAIITGKLSFALQYTDAAAELQPDWPDAYFLKASIYKELNKPKNVYEWVKVGSMKERPETLSVVNPTLYEYKALFLGALAAVELGKVVEAFQMLQIVVKKSPDYKPAKELYPIVEEMYYDSKAIDHAKWLLYYLSDNGGKPQKMLDALPQRVLTDPRLNSERAKIIPPVTWPEKSIVFYCGPAGEPWGPDTLAKGMGGSEEAIVYLSRELAKQGWNVTVFNDREEEYLDTQLDVKGNSQVSYKPWTMLNPYDEFDVFVAWRAPENVRGVKARKILVDLHDTVQPERVYNVAKEVPEVHYMVKSNYHRNLYPELDDSYFTVIGNGIVKEQFNA